MRLRFKATLLSTIGLFFALSNPTMADPFATCPSKAFLVQTSVAKLYGVNLVTGSSPLLSSDMGTTGKLNAMGFSVHDQYLYAWSYQHKTLARIGNDYQVEPLSVTNVPEKTFFVGDVSVAENRYYMYRRDTGYGLFSIDLNPTSPDYLNVVKRIDSSALRLTIYDLAFHPNNGFAYSVDSGGNLHQIDVASGSSSNLGNVGQRGTFGAVYFDVEGTFYISRNSDGNIFRIDVAAANPSAELFAIGPSSSNNDGARCAIAPLIDEDDTTVDYGDAPDTYGTSLANNGARHEIVPNGLFLGQRIDGEPVAAVYPSSDDNSGQSDEDGISFLSGFESGLTSAIQVEASKQGYLSAWLDTNLDGVFAENEKVINDLVVESGISRTNFIVPADALEGDSWMRFRLSDTPGLSAVGGIVDGEVEDYPVAISQTNLTTVYYPSGRSFVTLAYEDNWPEKGDYDVNDVVIKMRASASYSEDGLRKVKLEGYVTAVGASYHNGFAVRLYGVDVNSVERDTIRYMLNNELVSASPIESGNELIVVITDDVWKLVTPPTDCRYFNTQDGCIGGFGGEFSIELQIQETRNNSRFSVYNLDPFIFATPNTFHGDLLGEPGRGWEVHLKNHEPTEAFNYSLLGMADDASDPSAGYYFQSGNGMPWAFEITNDWAYPKEFTDLAVAYPDFQGFVESNGTSNSRWFMVSNAVASKVIY